MSYFIGQEISANEVEALTSKFGNDRFARLCNAMIWSLSSKTTVPIPSFTERVDTKDGGIDSEWHYMDEKDLVETQLLKKGWNVFQFKRRDVGGRTNVKDILSNLKTELSGAIKEVEERTGKTVSNYIFFLNLDLTHGTKAKNAAEAEKKSLIDAILKEGTDISSIVTIVGASEFAAFLNDNPHIRYAFFGSQYFSSWESFFEEEKIRKANSPESYIGRTEQLTELEKHFNDPRVKTIVIAGSPGVGKTRLVIESTKERSLNTIVIPNPALISPEELINALNPKKNVFILVEDPDEKVLDHLVNAILPKGNIKLIITYPTSSKAPQLHYGMDKERIKTINLEALSDNEARQLLKNVGLKLDYGIETLLIREAGGNPDILLSILFAKEKLAERNTDFLDPLAEALKAKMVKKYGEGFLPLIKPLTVTTFVGIAGSDKEELRKICTAFKFDNFSEIIEKIEELKNTGVVNIKGSFCEVRPPLLANKLAREVFSTDSDQLLDAFSIFDEKQRLRFIKRIKMIPPADLEKFWATFFCEDGDFENFNKALVNIELLKHVAIASPLNVIELLEKGFEEKGDLSKLKERSELKWIVEDLLFISETSKRAIVLMALLAKNETQNSIGNNSEKVFAGCFWPHHPQFPLSLKGRLEVLTEILKDDSERMKLLALEAVEETTGRHGSISLKPTLGSKPTETRPIIMRKEVWDYLGEMTNVALDFAKKDSSAVGQKAREILPGIISDYAIQVPPEDALKKCELLTGWIVDKEVDISVSAWGSKLSYIKRILADNLKRMEEGEGKNEIESYLNSIEGLIKRVEEEQDYGIRLKRWVGTWGFGDHDLVEEAKGLHRFETELIKLAEEAIANPEVLSADLIGWLLSPEAEKANTFFHYLGQEDKKRVWLSVINDLGKDDVGARIAFSSYYAGFASVHYNNFEKNLAKVTEDKDMKGIGITCGIAYLSSGELGLTLISELVKSNRYEPNTTVNIIGYSTWLKSLEDKQFEQFLSIIAGENLENAEAVVKLAHTWLYYKKEISKGMEDVIWPCLKQAPEVKLDNTAYNFNQVASKLAEKNHEEGFNLLEILLAQPYSKRTWKLFDFRTEREAFWNAVYKIAPNRCLDTIFKVIVEDKMTDASFKISEIIDSFDAEYLIEFSKKNPENAKFIVDKLTGKHSQYWLIASELLRFFPDDEKLRESLYHAAKMSSGIHSYSGHYSDYLKKQADQLEVYKEDPSLFGLVKSWINELQISLNKQVAEEKVREQNRNIDHF